MALVELPAPYADLEDLKKYWRALTDAEQGRATALLGWAAHEINQQVGYEKFDRLTCAQVSMDMVKRAMIASVNGDGVSSSTSGQAMADMTASTTTSYVNPVGNLYLTDKELARLTGRSESGGGLSLTLRSNARVPGQPWNRQPSTLPPDDAA